MLNVIAGIIFKGNKILIAKRSFGRSYSEFWEFPGGKLEKNETVEDCLKREIKEELNIEIEVVKFYLSSHFLSLDIDILLSAFLCKFRNGKVSLIDHSEYKWIPVNDIGKFNFAPPDLAIISKIQKEGLNFEALI